MHEIQGAAPYKYGSSERRRITESYTLANNYRIKITTWHDKARKAYLTSVSECMTEPREGGYTIERHTVYADFNRLVSSEPAARYSWQNMERVHNIAAESVGDLIRELLAAGASREIEAA